LFWTASTGRGFDGKDGAPFTVHFMSGKIGPFSKPSGYVRCVVDFNALEI